MNKNTGLAIQDNNRTNGLQHLIPMQKLLIVLTGCPKKNDKVNSENSEIQKNYKLNSEMLKMSEKNYKVNKRKSQKL